MLLYILHLRRVEECLSLPLTYTDQPKSTGQELSWEAEKEIQTTFFCGLNQAVDYRDWRSGGALAKKQACSTIKKSFCTTLDTSVII